MDNSQEHSPFEPGAVDTTTSTDNPNLLDMVPEKTELDFLKDRARKMGLTFSNNISTETLKKKIDEHLHKEAMEAVAQHDKTEPPVASANPKSARALFMKQEHDRAMRLRRVSVTPMDPARRDLPGELVSLGNEYIGNVVRFVPFTSPSSPTWHVPEVVLKRLQRAKYLHQRKVEEMREGQRIIRTETSWMPAFAVQVHPDLTKEELKKLADAQARGNLVRD